MSNVTKSSIQLPGADFFWTVPRSLMSHQFHSVLNSFHSYQLSQGILKRIINFYMKNDLISDEELFHKKEKFLFQVIFEDIYFLRQ